jgi:hypothetical protein
MAMKFRWRDGTCLAVAGFLQLGAAQAHRVLELLALLGFMRVPMKRTRGSSPLCCLKQRDLGALVAQRGQLRLVLLGRLMI